MIGARDSLIRRARDLVAAVVVRAVRMQYVERAVAVGGQSFAAMIPLLIVLGSVLTSAGAGQTSDSVIDRLDLTGAAAESVRIAFAPGAEFGNSIGLFGLGLLIFSMLSFARTLQRLYEFTFDLPALGLRATPSALAWVAAIAVLFAVRPAVGLATSGKVEFFVTLGTSGLLWLTTPYLLLARRVEPRTLLPCALLTAGSMLLYSSTSTLWFAESVASSAGQFGTLGVAFALLGWLTGAGFTIVAAACVAGGIRDIRTAPAEGSAA